MAQNQLSEDQIDALMNMTLADLPDLPSIEPFPNGTYLVNCTAFGAKLIGDHPAISIAFADPSVVEMADETETPPKTDAKTEYSWMLDNDIGQGKMKDVLSKFGAALNLSEEEQKELSMSRLKELLVGNAFEITVSRNWNAPKERFYGSIKSMVPV